MKESDPDIYVFFAWIDSFDSNTSLARKSDIVSSLLMHLSKYLILCFSEIKDPSMWSEEFFIDSIFLRWTRDSYIIYWFDLEEQYTSTLKESLQMIYTNIPIRSNLYCRYTKWESTKKTKTNRANFDMKTGCILITKIKWLSCLSR